MVLLSAVRSAAVSMPTSQPSSCVVTCPLNTDKSCSKEFVRLVCFLFVQCLITSLRDSVGAGGLSDIDRVCNLHSMFQSLNGLSFHSLNSLM